MKRRYLIVDLVNKVVFGTDNRKDAKSHVGDDNYIVVDAETGLVMKGGGEDNYSVLSLEDGLPEADDLTQGIVVYGEGETDPDLDDDYDDDDSDDEDDGDDYDDDSDDEAETPFRLLQGEGPGTARWVRLPGQE